ncbi:hypothetical protein RFI_16376 [Reticulomyxa filosa]|uniref:Serine aminopeptidase S33 domain-containing protein n=1 Tax=Reticulomyxa filosa TaxID=46433 RepID=X6N3H9_RETFI|nr:hypothetical protein RFI_16376 [Reticulomyxa filosa]|eukprot:ETO20835.1 hypothetical protein RFI_16376 [Reticulomyxa filosa]
MGNIVNQLAFLPPTNNEWRAELKEDEKLRQIVTSSGKKIAALWFEESGNDYTILYSHGNAEDLTTSKQCFEQLAFTLCVNVLAYDYEGYGLSEGEPSEKATYEDIEAAYCWLTKDKDGPKISPSKIILFGRSLGSGPTIHLAAKEQELAGLILQSPLRTAIKTQVYHWVAGSVLRPADIFHNEKKIVNVTQCPVFIIHGKADRVVPFSHGEYLYDQIKKNTKHEVRSYWVDDCGHNDIELNKGEEYDAQLLKFVDECIRNKYKKNKNQNDTELETETMAYFDVNDKIEEKIDNEQLTNLDED